MDESCESLVETAAKSLLNIRNIEELKKSLNDPKHPVNSTFDGMFSNSLLQDINQATKTRLTPVSIVQSADGTKVVKCSLEVPHSIKTASLGQFANHLSNISNNNDENKPTNHLNIRYSGSKLILDALTKSDNATSTFSKEINLPKGSQLDQLKFSLDQDKHSLLIEAPYSK